MSYLRFALIWSMVTFFAALLLFNVDKPAPFRGRDAGRLMVAAVLGLIGAYLFFASAS